ncbi:MAG: peptidase M15 [Rikenellaceae bacterium]|nr:peptidase M15 [Rikenellaceae bacterium]
MTHRTTTPHNDLEAQFRAYGLVDIHDLAPEIGVELKYATPDNFTGRNLYGALGKAYLVPEIAARVVAAQRALCVARPGHRLLIYDAARPIGIQRFMYSLVAGTPQARYVADPETGGYHNYGVAVDLTIAGPDGRPLDMGCPFDCFDPISHVGHEEEYVACGQMSREALANRRQLAALMTDAGFTQNPDEWWHFQRYTPDELRRRFRLLDF